MNVEAIEAERGKIISKLPDRDLQFLEYSDRIDTFNNLARYGTHILTSYQEPNGLIQASLGRFDDEHFKDKVWIKDAVRAGRAILDPYVQRYLPALEPELRNLYLSSTQANLRILAKDEVFSRFKTRPGNADSLGYASIDDRDVPYIKFDTEGNPIYDWGHNQPDNWGTFLLETGRGIAEGMPVLELDTQNNRTAGQVILEVASYLANLKLERFIARSIWEHDLGPSSYSTRTIGFAGLRQISSDIVWQKIETDAQVKGYNIVIGQDEIKSAAGQLAKLRKEHFPADKTNSPDKHPKDTDAAQIIVLNDTNLPGGEVADIIRGAMDLKNGVGFSRYKGDHWEKGRAEAKWTLPFPAMERHFFKESVNFYEYNQDDLGHKALDYGMEYMDICIRLIRMFGYMPELIRDKNGVSKPNNNELAWLQPYLIEASAAGIAATIADFRSTISVL